jgi:hypothetical protein
MSTVLWKALKFSSTLLGTLLLFAGSTLAQETVPQPRAASTAEVSAAPSTELPQTQVVASSAPAPQSAAEPITASTAEVSAAPSTELPQTQVVASSAPASPSVAEPITASTTKVSAAPSTELTQTQEVASNSTAPQNTSEQTAASTNEVSATPSTELTQTQEVAKNTPAPQSVAEQTAEVSPTSQAAVPAESAVAASTELPQRAVEETSVSQLTPSDASANVNRTESTLAQQVPAAGSTNTELLQQIQQYESLPGVPVDNGQVTNVTQLSDVRPTDWAYEALRSLVERYGCIAGYPDGTYRGNRAMTRYEFAAGLNACLQQIERLITTATENFVTKQDLETITRLVEEFRSELTALGTRVDTLEGRVAFLEDRQFSTTTKLRGEVIFNIADLFGEDAGLGPGGSRSLAPLPGGGTDYVNDETVAQYRVRLNFDTSFTGRDLLRTRLQAANIREFGPLTGGLGTPGGNTLGTNLTREGRFGFQANTETENDVIIDRLFYRFPLGNFAQVYLGANALQFEDFVELLNPGLDPSGTGALSRFGRYSPIYRMGGQSQGIGVSIGPRGPLRLDLGYLTNFGNIPEEKNGLFDGNYTALGQLTFQPFSALRIAATFAHTYDRNNLRHGTGSIASQVYTGALGVGQPVVGNSYGLEASFALSPKFIISGWGMATDARVIGRGDADIWSWAGTLSINDLGPKGSTLGFVVGMEPKLTGADAVLAGGQPSGISGLATGRRSDRDTGLHIEGFYKFRVNPNVLITPGVIWLTAPGHDQRNDDIFIGTLRTTFTF